MSFKRVTNTRSFTPGGYLGGSSRGGKGPKRFGRGRDRNANALMAGIRREYPFDMNYLRFLIRMYDEVPGFQFGRRAMQARLFCERFMVVFKNWPTEYGPKDMNIDKELEGVIDRFWMPSCKRMFDFWSGWGFFPYVWMQVPGERHWYPTLPKLDTYFLTFEEDRFGTIYRLYWTDDVQPEMAPEVFFEVGDQEPEGGRIRTAVASLARDYELYLVNMAAHLDAIPNGAAPFHLFEHHPKMSSDLQELHMTRLASGQESALASFYRREQDLTERDVVRRDHLEAALQHAYDMNFGGTEGGLGPGHVDPGMMELQRTHGKFLARVTTLNSDYVYKSAAQSTILMPLEDIWRKLNRDAANALGFPLEFAQSQSAQRSANVEGNTRFINENVKDNLRTWSRIVRHMFVVSPYGRIVSKVNKLISTTKEMEKAASGKKASQRLADNANTRIGYRSAPIRPPDLRLEYELLKNVEVDVTFMCTPEMSYEQLRQLVIDEVIEHPCFIKHAGDMFGLPESILSTNKDLKLPEQKQMEITEKDAKERWKMQRDALKHQQSADKGASSVPPRQASSGERKYT